MEADVGDRGPGDEADHGQGPRRLPRSTRVPDADMTRIERLAAVLVDPGGDATLFTDFRYVRRAAAIEGVRFERTARLVIGDLATRLAGQTIGIEAHVMTVAALETLREGGVETV